MAYVAKPSGTKRKAFGISLDETTVARIDALAEASIPGGAHGRRSLFVRDLIELGLSQRFGANWREMADRMRGPVAA